MNADYKGLRTPLSLLNNTGKITIRTVTNKSSTIAKWKIQSKAQRKRMISFFVVKFSINTVVQ